MQNLSEFVKVLDVLQVIGNADIKISGISYDSRKVQADMLFVAIKGEQFDGHDYIRFAIDQGAKAIVCEYIPSGITQDGVAFILVEDSRATLAQISHQWYNFPTSDMTVIGVTGTNGKTTITFLLKKIFEKAGNKTGIIGTTGIFIGDDEFPATHTTPESLELAAVFDNMRQEKVDVCIMEVSSHALSQKRVNNIKFKCAIFTNLSHDHLDYHKTMDNYAEAKKILFNLLDPDRFAVVNGDDKFASLMVTGIKSDEICLVGRKVDSEFRIINEKIGLKDSSFELNNKLYSTILPGRFNVENVSLSIAAALKLGIADNIIASALRTAQGAPGRMQRIDLYSGASAFVDYAHTPDALENALSTCKEILELNNNENARLICVFGCGGDRDSSKRPVMGKIAAKIADVAIVTNDNPRTEAPINIINDILSGIEDKGKCLIIQNRAYAIKKACAIAKEGDIVLIAGKGHEKYQIIGTEKLHFDDVEEVRKFS